MSCAPTERNIPIFFYVDLGNQTALLGEPEESVRGDVPVNEIWDMAADVQFNMPIDYVNSLGTPIGDQQAHELDGDISVKLLVGGNFVLATSTPDSLRFTRESDNAWRLNSIECEKLKAESSSQTD